MTLATVREWITTSERIVILTGAGISTDSGIPDYRSNAGVWKANPGAEWASRIEQYVADPELRKRAWLARLSDPRNAVPNAGHYALARLQQMFNAELLVTQNIDGLHQAAGSDPATLLELHGHDRDARCLDCEYRAPIRDVLDRVCAGDWDPHCECGGLLKPAVVSFGQSLDVPQWERAKAAAEQCDLIIAIGTTLMVPPACALVPIAKDFAGAKVVIINRDETLMDFRADAILRGSISEILPQLLAVAA